VGQPQAITVYDGARSYQDVSVITTQDLFPDRFVKITKSVCFGDWGGAGRARRALAQHHLHDDERSRCPSPPERTSRPQTCTLRTPPDVMMAE
jgi:hypothetical protein